MPRLFTGLTLPPTYRTALHLMQSGLPDARWIEPTDLHITLRFIGDVTPSFADEIAFELGRRDWPSPEIILGNVDSFGKRKPRSIHVAVEPCKTLLRLQNSQERLLHNLGLQPDGRKFTPHITLARGSKWSAFSIEAWCAQTGGLKLEPYQPDQVHLYSARESTGGGPYIIEKSYPLAKATKNSAT